MKVNWNLWAFVSILSTYFGCKMHLMNVQTLILLVLSQISVLSNYLLQVVLQILPSMIPFQMTLTCLVVGQNSDDDAPLEINDNDYQISVPIISAVQIWEEMLTFLEEQVDVFANDDRDARSIYQSCVQLVQTYFTGNNEN